MKQAPRRKRGHCVHSIRVLRRTVGALRAPQDQCMRMLYEGARNFVAKKSEVPASVWKASPDVKEVSPQRRVCV